MSKSIEKQIKELRKSNREKINDYRSSLEKELYDFCQENTGHNFGDWVSHNYHHFAAGFIFFKIRSCSYCGKKEEYYYRCPNCRKITNSEGAVCYWCEDDRD